jgi:hypothetical protein
MWCGLENRAIDAVTKWFLMRVEREPNKSGPRDAGRLSISKQSPT